MNSVSKTEMLKKLRVNTLRVLASRHNIPYYGILKKDDLVKSLDRETIDSSKIRLKEMKDIHKQL